jgi:hypothetical protein
MVVAGQMSGHNERLPAWRRPEAKFAKGTEIDMQSYADLHALIKKQVREGRVLSDWKSATHSDEINEWIQVSRKCLILMENLIPTLLREFEGLHFHFRVPEEAMFSEVLEEGGGMRTVAKVLKKVVAEGEDRWSQSWFFDEGEHP